jgi:phosphoribosylanthranilate isomerase
MSLWVKVCGNTSLADAQLAASAGADAVGFIYAPSPRRVHAEQVAAITSKLPATIEKIGVFVDANFDGIVTTVEESGLTGVQLHSNNQDGIAKKLRDHFGARLRILQVIHYSVDAAAQLALVAQESAIDGVLVDSRTATAVGGTGVAFDWADARESLFSPESPIKLIAAGGLSPANVAEAIKTLRPWGVDVVSGVERTRGQKDPAKVEEFVRAARAAAALEVLLPEVL